MNPLIYKLDIAAPRDRVWDAWTTEEGLRSWLCLRAIVEPRVGGRFELFWNPDAAKPKSDSTFGCRILSIERPRLIHFTWRGSDDVADVMNQPEAPVTQVKVELIPTLDGTRLEITHFGWGDGPGWEQARSWFDRAWSGALEKLKTNFRKTDL